MARRANRSGTLYRRGSVWYAKIKVGGKWVRQSTGTESKDKARKVLDELARGCNLTDGERLAAIQARLKPSAPNPTLAEAFGLYLAAPEAAGLSDDREARNRCAWQRFTAWIASNRPDIRRLGDVPPSVASAYVADLRAAFAPQTANTHMMLCRRVWRLCGVADNPWTGFRRVKATPHLRRALTDEEVSRLISSAQGELRTLFAVGAFTGLRLGDCARVKWEDFDADMRTIAVRPSKTAHSSGRVVAIPLHPSLVKILGVRRPSGFVMPELATMDAHARSRAVMRHFRECGFEEPAEVEGFAHRVAVVGFHSLRSTFITNMANIGAPMAMVQAIVGHMTPEMSLHYYRANADAARARIEALPGYGI